MTNTTADLPPNEGADFNFWEDVIGDDLVVGGVVYSSREWQYDGEGGVERRRHRPCHGHANGDAPQQRRVPGHGPTQQTNEEREPMNHIVLTLLTPTLTFVVLGGTAAGTVIGYVSRFRWTVSMPAGWDAIDGYRAGYLTGRWNIEPDTAQLDADTGAVEFTAGYVNGAADRAAPKPGRDRRLLTRLHRAESCPAVRQQITVQHAAMTSPNRAARHGLLRAETV